MKAGRKKKWEREEEVIEVGIEKKDQQGSEMF